MFEYLLILAVVLVLLLGPLVLSIAAFVRSLRVGELSRRVERLETVVRELRAARRESVATPAAPTEPEPAEAPAPLVEVSAAPPVGPFDWESFIGRRALGWVAVVLIVFAAAFFLRYAFENNWIGPIGRVALAALGGLALVYAGWHHDRRGGRLFAQMLTAAGSVLFYLSAYSAFGFYHLLPQRAAAGFLLIIIVETMVLAVQYEAPALALVAVLGGLLTPVLMQSESDQYKALFLYLATLDAGVALLAVRRPWPVVTSVALLGSQALFWTWYGPNIHPEKMGAALAFQAAVFVLFLGQGLAAHAIGRRPARWEDLGRWLLNAFFGFLGLYLLLNPDHRVWMGTLALVMAALYAELARWMLIRRPDDERLFLTTLAVAVGFIAASFPIQAGAAWVALGWAAEASVLWWFGLRVRQAPLRGLAAILALMASIRVVFDDTLGHPHAPFFPVFNDEALPAIGASTCVLAAFAATRRLRVGLGPAERAAVAAVEVVALLQLWLVLTIDLDGYCRTVFGATAGGDDRLAPMAVSVLWAVYATAVLAVGFRVDQTRLRWTALALYGVTVGKVFLFDMAGLDEVYRILAFLVLAIVLGVAAGVYQRTRPARAKPGRQEV